MVVAERGAMVLWMLLRERRVPYLSSNGSKEIKKAPGRRGNSSRSAVLRVLAPTSIMISVVPGGMGSVPFARSLATSMVAESITLVTGLQVFPD